MADGRFDSSGFDGALQRREVAIARLGAAMRLGQLVSVLTFNRFLDRGGTGLRPCPWFAQSVIGRIAFLDMLAGASVVLAEGSLLTTNQFLLESKEFFQLLQAKNVVTHLRIGEDLGGCGLTAALESALLTIEKILAKANQLSYLFELKKALLQVLGQATA